ncbi:MAG TPA: flavin monoamine oxidase family protein [Solirubrobacterales bacterium]|nr:flavin monoamine oxidase family protein [Solirubrobacterales bacterium]
MTPNGTIDVDVAIVGAGMAGLSAALELERAGRSFVVLEARDRAGGRLESQPLGEGAWIDVGGQWVGPTQDRLYALARAHGAETFPTWTAGQNVVELGGRLTRYTGTIPKLRPHVMADVGQAMARLDRMAQKVPPEAPWNAPKAKQWDSQTVWSWMRHNMVTPTGREMMEIAVKAVWAAMPADVSLLHLLFYISSAGNFDLLLDTEGGAQQDRFVEGAGTLAGRVAESLGDRVLFSSPVRRIEWSPRAVGLTGDDVRVRAGRAIVAVPPVLAGRIRYDPPLPGYRDQLTQRVPMGTVIKCFAIYDEPFWRSDGLSGSAVSGSGPLTLTVDNSPPSGSPGILVGFLEGDHARSFGRVPAADRREAVIANLVQLFGTRAGQVDQFIEKSWAEEEWSRGCYEGFTPPGVLTAYGPALREPIGPLHWAGTETATKWNGYIDGALQSGERAAREVLQELPAKTAAAVG